MSRRDTIIVAVLINAGLLVVLFVSALKSQRDLPALALESSSSLPVVTEIAVRNEGQVAAGDEVDAALKQMQASSSIPVQQPQPNFAQDLTAIAFSTQAEPPASFGQPPLALEVPSAQPKESAPVSSGYKEVKVRKGDVLERIARVNHTSVAEIMRVNQLTSTRLKIGQVLRVPSTPSKAKASVPSAGTEETTLKYYTVKNGDNPWTIAVKNHLKVDELLKLNNLDEEKARRLKPGDQIRIR